MSTNLIGIILVVRCNIGGIKFVLRYPPAHEGELETFHTMPPPLLASILTPKEKFCQEGSFELLIGDCLYLGFPISFSHLPYTPEAIKARDSSLKDELQVLNTIFVISRSFSPGIKERHQDTVETVHHYKNACKKLAIAFRHEECRVAYMSTEIAKIFHIQDLFSTKTESLLMQQYLKASRLVKEFKELYHGLHTYHYAKIFVNGWIQYSLIPTPLYLKSLDFLRPYHTLLLDNYDSSELPFGFSKELKHLIDTINPSLSFSDLQLIMGISLNQIFRYVSHLLMHRKARIAPVMTTESIFVVNLVGISESSITTLSQQFHKHFLPFSLAELLTQFSVSITLKQHLQTIPSTHHQLFISAVGWIFSQNLLKLLQYHIFAFFDISLRNFDEKSLEKRLFPYFNGKFPIEEILFRENISKKALTQFLNKYKKYLFQVLL